MSAGHGGDPVFGEGSSDIRGWLDRHVRRYLQVRVRTVLFDEASVGRAVGLQLIDGRRVVVKAVRRGADLERLRAVVDCQNRLAATGSWCARALDGPSSTDGVVAIVEELLDVEPSGNPHQSAARAAMAEGLARQLHSLAGVNGSALMSGRPAWTNWDSGAWPQPHDPIFDFTSVATGFGWVDDEADDAAAVLWVDAGHPPVIGHADWVWQNVCVNDGRFLAAFDWDSLAWLPECDVVGLTAGMFTQGSPVPPDAPDVAEMAAFVADYQAAAGRRFDGCERVRINAAARWVRCYNARCQLDNLVRRGMPMPAGSFLDQLRAELCR